MVIRREGCWGWKGKPDKDGYGRLGAGGGQAPFIRAHRVSYELFRGPIPKGLDVLHHCDTPGCTRPDHLFAGTAQDNSTGMVRKNRQAKGEAHGLRLHPECIAKGDRQGLRKHPEARPRGVRHGRYTQPERTARGERSGSTKLTTKQVLAIRDEYSNGVGLSELGRRHGVTPQSVSGIVKRKTWAHVA
jgi:hypothetical protein